MLAEIVGLNAESEHLVERVHAPIVKYSRLMWDSTKLIPNILTISENIFPNQITPITRALLNGYKAGTKQYTLKCIRVANSACCLALDRSLRYNLCALRDYIFESLKVLIY